MGKWNFSPNRDFKRWRQRLRHNDKDGPRWQNAPTRKTRRLVLHDHFATTTGSAYLHLSGIVATREMVFGFDALRVSWIGATTRPCGSSAAMAAALPESARLRRKREQHHGENRQMRKCLQKSANKRTRLGWPHNGEFYKRLDFPKVFIRLQSTKVGVRRKHKRLVNIRQRQLAPQ